MFTLENIKLEHIQPFVFLWLCPDLLVKIFMINIMPTIDTIPDMDSEIIQFSCKADFRERGNPYHKYRIL